MGNKFQTNFNLGSGTNPMAGMLYANNQVADILGNMQSRRDTMAADALLRKDKLAAIDENKRRYESGLILDAKNRVTDRNNELGDATTLFNRKKTTASKARNNNIFDDNLGIQRKIANDAINNYLIGGGKAEGYTGLPQSVIDFNAKNKERQGFTPITGTADLPFITAQKASNAASRATTALRAEELENIRANKRKADAEVFAKNELYGYSPSGIKDLTPEQIAKNDQSVVDTQTDLDFIKDFRENAPITKAGKYKNLTPEQQRIIDVGEAKLAPSDFKAKVVDPLAQPWVAFGKDLSKVGSDTSNFLFSSDAYENAKANLKNQQDQDALALMNSKKPLNKEEQSKVDTFKNNRQDPTKAYREKMVNIFNKQNQKNTFEDKAEVDKYAKMAENSINEFYKGEKIKPTEFRDRKDYERINNDRFKELQSVVKEREGRNLSKPESDAVRAYFRNITDNNINQQNQAQIDSNVYQRAINMEKIKAKYKTEGAIKVAHEKAKIDLEKAIQENKLPTNITPKEKVELTIRMLDKGINSDELKFALQQIRNIK